MKKLLLSLMLISCIATNAQKNDKLFWFPYYVAYNQSFPSGELGTFNGWHAEVPFVTVGMEWPSLAIGSKYYTTDIHGYLTGGWDAKLYSMTNIHAGINAPLKYARPTIGANITLVPEGLQEGNQLWLNNGPFKEAYYDSYLKGCYVGLYFGVTSAIPASPVQVGISFKTFNDDLKNLCSVNKVCFGWNVGVDLGWLKRFFQKNSSNTNE